MNKDITLIEEDSKGNETDGYITNPFSTKDIKINNAVISLSSLIERLEYKEIDLNPDFQRHVIVAILKAEEGDLLVIENSESHLHPKAQGKIAELCAIASSIEIQIILETHSDHILNGIRVATKKGILKSEQSKIYYFRKEQNRLET